MKCHRSQSRRCKVRLTLPFPLQDSEGRLTSVSQLYKYVGEQPVSCHNVAGRGIMHPSGGAAMKGHVPRKSGH